MSEEVDYSDYEAAGFILPKGECAYCDAEREAGTRFFPPHRSNDWCRSGKSNHCTCDSCF